jgi:hypothetical protein
MLRRLLRIRRRGKATVIRAIVNLFPQRRFVLIGDSGEKDPEIYGDVARRFPDRVSAIFIREMPEYHRLDQPRAKKAFRGSPKRSYCVFQRAEELQDRLPFEFPRTPLVIAAHWSIISDWCLGRHPPQFTRFLAEKEKLLNGSLHWSKGEGQPASESVDL